MLTTIRQRIWRVVVLCNAVVILLFFASLSSAADRFKVAHPLMPPSTVFSGQCPVCGMVRAMWARTWIEFNETDGVSQVCSFHCLADLTHKSGVLPENIRLAVYHAPQSMIESGRATIVVGSSARGTMSPRSKVVFAGVQQAKAFAAARGGEILSFKDALEIARADVSRENAILVKRRLKRGKIVEPKADDRCTVCEMFPARYPRSKCQIHATDATLHHFCSTQCMFAFLGNPGKYIKPAFKPQLVWVVDWRSGRWISGRSAYYVVGATDILGPMGFEAFPFDLKSGAESFVRENEGRIVLFNDLTIDEIMRP